jgi:hypothetical protein
VVELGTVAGPVKTTLLSLTCNLAAGVVIPIPTFCAYELKQEKMMRR